MYDENYKKKNVILNEFNIFFMFCIKYIKLILFKVV